MKDGAKRLHAVAAALMYASDPKYARAFDAVIVVERLRLAEQEKRVAISKALDRT